MGLFDKFKKKKNRDINSEEEFNIDNSKNTEDSYLDKLSNNDEEETPKDEEITLINEKQKIVETTKESLDNANTIIEKVTVVYTEEYKEEDQEERIKKYAFQDEFSDKYGDIDSFKTVLSMYERNGIQIGSKELEKYLKFSKVVASDPDKLREFLFFPYNLEKSQYKLLSEEESIELDKQLDEIGDKNSLGYFKTMLALYQTIGLISIEDDDSFIKTFINYYGLDDNQIMDAKKSILKQVDAYTSSIEE